MLGNILKGLVEIAAIVLSGDSQSATETCPYCRQTKYRGVACRNCWDGGQNKPWQYK